MSDEPVIVINKDPEDNKYRHSEWAEPPISDGFHFKKYLSQDKYKNDLETIKSDTLRVLSNCRSPNNLGHPDSFDSTGLIIGDIQSGKTSSMEAVSCMARDNNYQVIIIISGIVENLTTQTFNRFFGTFNEPGWLVKKVLSRKPKDNDFHDAVMTNTRDEIIETLKKWHSKLWQDDQLEKKSIVIVIPKRPIWMLAVANTFKEISKIYHEKIPTLIIDDESDQQTKNVAGRNVQYETQKIINKCQLWEIASQLDLNINYLAELNNLHPLDMIEAGQEIIIGEPSTPNYSALKYLRSSLPFNSHLFYTATPQADLVMAYLDQMKPKFHWPLTPGRDYTGYEFFFQSPLTRHFLSENITSEEIESLTENNDTPESLETAINYFLVSVAIGIYHGENKDKENNRSMFVNMTNRSRITTPSGSSYLSSENLRIKVSDYLNNLKIYLDPDRNEPAYDEYIKKFEDTFLDLSSQNNVNNSKVNIPRWNGDFINNIRKACESIRIVELTSNTGEEVKWDEIQYAWILIGGIKLGRGFTLEGLTVTYLANVAASTPIDTLEQRARFYGYRKDYAGLTKLFLSEDISHTYNTEGRHRQFLIKELKKTAGYIGGTDEWTLKLFALGNHPITRKLAIKADHISTKAKSRTDNRYSHDMSQEKINENLILLQSFMSNPLPLKEFCHQEYIKDEKVIEGKKLSDIYNILSQFHFSTSDTYKWEVTKSILDLNIKYYNRNKECPIVIMNNYLYEVSKKNPERKLTETLKNINPNRGHDPGNAGRPGDNRWHYELLKGQHNELDPFTTPTLRVFVYDVFDRDINHTLLRTRVPFLTLHLPDDMTDLNIITGPQFESENES